MPILNDIIDWVENKPIFWQIAINRLIRNNNLSEHDIEELTKICKTEHGLVNFNYTLVDFEDLREFSSRTTSTDNIILSKVFNVENINALKKSSSLEFAPNGLTVIYGDNGAGKSSYVSILKHTCNTRGRKPAINGNLYNPTIYNNDKKAEVEYTIDGTNFDTVELLNDSINKSVLKSVDVFDAFSANHYIENEDEIAFIPKGLSLIEKFAVNIKKIEEKLNLELHTPSLAQFDYRNLLDVPETSSANKFITRLSSNTNLDDLRTESQWNQSNHEKAIKLREKIQKLKSTDPTQLEKINEEKIKRFEILKNKFKAIEGKLNGDVLISFKTILNNYINAKEALKVSSKKAFSSLPIDGVGNEIWKILWESARRFYDESKGRELFPDIEGICPLCLQDLSDDAKTRFVNFEEFIKNDIQERYEKATQKYSCLLQSLSDLSFDFREHEPTLNEIDELIENFTSNQIGFLQILTNQQKRLISILEAKQLIESVSEIKFDINSREEIEELIKNLKKENEKLKTQSIEEALKPLEQELNQLKGQKKIFDFKPKLAREIYRQKKVKLLNDCIGKCRTNSITSLSNDLASSYVNQNLKDSFKLELRNLSFTNIRIETETRGSRGKQYHYLKLDEPNSSNVSLKDILSEGEHRCISLATFLSELSLSDNNSSIIFDDPVSSLDHKWRNRIARRIAVESNNRQVIVFTHDITFLLMLQEHSEKIACDLEIKSLTRKKQETGLIAKNPPWDALPIKKRIGVLKDAYQILEKTERTETEETYKEQLKPCYGKLRESWERLIEEVLLNGSVQRFGREIQTQRLSKVIDLTEEDYNKVDENMKKCSTYMDGHDSAGNLIEQIPTSEEFLDDIKILEEFTKEIRRRRS